MMDHPDIRALLQTLRVVLKAKGYTYARLAREMNLSEVTVKRLFAGQGCTLERVTAICERLGTTLFSVAALANQDEEVDYVLSQKQEAFFAAAPAYFGIFKELYRGQTPKEVAQAWRLNAAKLHQVLRALEKQGLLEVLPENRVKLKVRGTIRMQHQGPLARRILRPQILDFLDQVDVDLKNDDVCMHSAEIELSPKHIAEFVEEIHALGAKYRARAFRDQSLLPREKLRSVRWLLAFAPYRTNWQKFKVI